MIQNFYYKNLQILEQMSYLEEVKKELIIFNFPQKNLHEHEHISFRNLGTTVIFLQTPV